MKMKLKNRNGKVHPSPSSLPSSLALSSNSTSDPISGLNLILTAAIITQISALSPQDREVLTYMITIHSPNSSPLSSLEKHKTSKKFHRSPSPHCDCFDCYAAFWFRWNSSPHRELIDQVMDAFEEHSAKPNKSSRSRKREKQKEKEKESVARPAASENGESPAVEEETNGGHGKNLQQSRGLTRKILPDVIGFFQSRIWNLWVPNL